MSNNQGDCKSHGLSAELDWYMAMVLAASPALCPSCGWESGFVLVREQLIDGIGLRCHRCGWWAIVRPPAPKPSRLPRRNAARYRQHWPPRG